MNQECLVVLHSGGMVRLYSLQHIVAEVGVKSLYLNIAKHEGMCTFLVVVI